MRKRRQSKPLKERFDTKWQPEASSGCWLWHGAVSGGKWGGYGIMRINGHGKAATRISWELHRGKIPKGIFVCHKCDVPGCVNPDHLFLGTPSDNTQDMVNKNRRIYLKGQEARTAKLTNKDVRLIKASSETGVALAKKFGVVHQTISWIRTGRRWQHV